MYEDLVITLQNSINNFNSTFKNTRLTNNLKFTLKRAEDKIKTVRPINIRNKRGLINLGGSVLNFLFGTMDEDDKREMMSHFDVMDKNDHNIINQMNKQVNINSEIQNNMKLLAEKINENQIYLINSIKNIPASQKLNVETLQFLQMELDINYLINEIEKIQDLITFSRIGIMGRNILNNDEIRKFEINSRNSKLIVEKLKFFPFGQFLQHIGI